jgi:hypothetical protein
MASAAFSTKNDREMFTLASKFSDKLSAFPNKDEGWCFPSDTRDFHHQHCRKTFSTVNDV